MSTLQQQDKKPANPLKTLLDLGKSKGQLSSKEILDVLGDELDPEQIEKIYDALESNGIEIIEDTEDLSLDDLNINENSDDDAEPGGIRGHIGLFIHTGKEPRRDALPADAQRVGPAGAAHHQAIGSTQAADNNKYKYNGTGGRAK